VWLAAAAWEKPEVAAWTGQAKEPRRSQAARPSVRIRAGSRGLVWALEAAADPIPVRHYQRAAQSGALGAAATEYEAGPVRKCSPLGRRSAVVVVAEPAATGLAVAEPAATGLAVAEPAATGLAVVEPAATGLAVVEPAATGLAVVEPAATGPAAAEAWGTHPVSVALAVEGPVSVALAVGRPVSVASVVEAPVAAGSAAQAHVSGGSAELSGIRRQMQAAVGRQTQEAGRPCSYQPLWPERLGAYAWSLAALHGLLCSGRSNSLEPEHSRPAHLDALPRSPRRG
jgi:hypothetical protein